MRIAGECEMSCDFVIHIVDNDAAILDALRLLLATEGYAVRTHQSARGFLDAIQQDDCGCVVAEMHMPEMGGMGYLKKPFDGDDLLVSIHAGFDAHISSALGSPVS
jgi:two-component system response regulator FixJ